jgi:hypothetical protein
VHDTLLERLAQGLEDLAAEFVELIQEKPAVVRPRHLIRSGEGPTVEPFHIRDGVMRGQGQEGSDHRRAGAAQSGDTVHARGPERFGQRYRRQDGGEAPGQPRLPRPRGPEEGRAFEHNAGIRFSFTLAPGEWRSAPLTRAHSWSTGDDGDHDSSSSSALASCRSAVSKPSENQP